eukprot:5228741-Amphidinium_carterae.1
MVKDPDVEGQGLRSMRPTNHGFAKAQMTQDLRNQARMLKPQCTRVIGATEMHPSACNPKQATTH